MSALEAIRFSTGVACRRPMPEDLLARDSAVFAAASFYAGADAFARPVPDLAFSSKGEFFEGQELCPEYYPANDTALRIKPNQARARAGRSRTDATAYSGNWLWITDRFSANYYHWLCDCLPRLEAWIASDNGPKRLLLPRAVFDQHFVRESLRAYPEIDVGEPPIGLRGGLVERAWILGPVAANGSHHPKWMAAVANRLHKHFRASGAGGARLWVSRSAASKRRVANEADLLPLLDRHGFRSVSMEHLPFAEQVRLAASASILAGPHGAGLANMAFMRPGGAAIELRQVAGTINCFHSLAAATRQRYFYLPCDAAEHSQSVHAADLSCEPKALDDLLSNVAGVAP